MDRRHFLQVGGASASVGATACGGLTPGAVASLGGQTEGPSGPEQIEAMLADWDRTWDSLGQASFVESQLGTHEPEHVRRHAEQVDAYATKALRAMFIAGSYSSLSPADQSNPRVRERVGQAMPVMDQAVGEACHRLESLTPSEVADLSDALKRDPDLTLRIGQELEQGAVTEKVALAERLKMRRIVTHLNWRLTKQPPGLVLGEQVRKSRKLERRFASDEQAQQRLAAHFAHAAMWTTDASSTVPSEGGGAGNTEGVPELETEEERKQRNNARKAKKVLIASGISAGAGAILLGVGIALLAGSGGGATAGGLIMLTVGSLALVGALVLGIIGLVYLARS